MLTFSYIDRERLSEELPALFPILYANMSSIVPTEESFAAQYAEWFENVRPALEKPNRRMIVIRSDGELVGFFQYYVNETVFMMEEIQFVPGICGCGVFEALFTYLSDVVPNNTPFVEAYSHRLNLKSQGILLHLGLEPREADGSFIRFRGELSRLFQTIRSSSAKIPEFTVI